MIKQSEAGWLSGRVRVQTVILTCEQKKYIGIDRYPNRMPGEKRIILKNKLDRVFQMKLH
jgi:hypothetical protein